jgi:hypothetical protein
MKPMNFKKILIVFFISLFSLQALHAQLYKVYGYQPAEAGELEFVLWNSYIPSSNLSYNFFGKTLDRKGLLAHSLELEYGLSNKFGIAAYLDFEDPKGGSLKQVRTKAIMAHYAFFEKGSRPLDIAIYLEYIINNKAYKDYEELEIRLILEKDIGDFRIDFNPIFEFYGKMGEISDFKPLKGQRHYIFPTLDFYIGKRLRWHTGVGFGLTEAADDITIKSILSFILKF